MMTYLRFATYAMLLAAVAVVAFWQRKALPVQLQGPSYDEQAAALNAAGMAKDLATAFGVSGGLPEGASWNYREGPDFDVWTSRYRMVDADVTVGVYWGRYPQVKPPVIGLSPGTVGGVAVLWWKRTDRDYLTMWDAVIPKPDGTRIHVWISSAHPQRVEEAAALLETVRFAR